MNKELESKKHPDNWLEEDIDLMDDHLWVESRKALKEIIKTKTYKKVSLKKRNKEEIGIAIVELRNHLHRNISALDERFKHDFDSKFVQDVKDAFDFNYMIDIMEEVNNKEKTSEEAFVEVETHGNNAVKSLLLTQSKANPIKQEEIIKTIAEYKEVKNLHLIF